MTDSTQENSQGKKEETIKQKQKLLEFHLKMKNRILECIKKYSVLITSQQLS